jgi:hypothetical protein
VSYGLTGYLVRTPILQRLAAGSDPGAIDDVIDFAADRDSVPGLAVALRRLAGGGVEPDQPSVSVYALEVLCDYFGTVLPNDSVAPIGGPDALDEFSAALAEAGVGGYPLPRDLVDFRPPVSLPPTDDVPFVHTVPRTDGYRIGMAYEAALPALDDTEWGPAADQLVEWFFGAHRSGKDLIIFYY